MNTHKKLMGALNLAKDCYETKIGLLGDDKAIKHFTDFYIQQKSEATAAANAYDKELAELNERERHRREAIF